MDTNINWILIISGLRRGYTIKNGRTDDIGDIEMIGTFFGWFENHNQNV